MCMVAVNSSVWCISAGGAATFVCLAAPWQPHVHLAHCGPTVAPFSSLSSGPCKKGWVLSARLQDSLWAHVQTRSHTHSKQPLTGRTWMGSRRADIVSVQTMRFLQYQSVYACSSSFSFLKRASVCVSVVNLHEGASQRGSRGRTANEGIRDP